MDVNKMFIPCIPRMVFKHYGHPYEKATDLVEKTTIKLSGDRKTCRKINMISKDNHTASQNGQNSSNAKNVYDNEYAVGEQQNTQKKTVVK